MCEDDDVPALACQRCGHEFGGIRRHHARGLCRGCHSASDTDGTLADYPRRGRCGFDPQRHARAIETMLRTLERRMPRWVRCLDGDDESDFAVVDQAMQGWWRASDMHPADRVATVAELWRRGTSVVDTAELLSTTKRAVEADRQRLRYLARKARAS